MPGLNTIQDAHSVLRGEGLIEPVQGKGTFVIGKPAQDERTALRDDVKELRAALELAQAALKRLSARLDH